MLDKLKKMRHSLRVNILFATISVSLIASVLLLNGIALRLSDRHHMQIDLTAGAVFEIGSDTKAFLAALDVPVRIYVLSDEGGFTGSRYLVQVKQIIDQYPRFSGMISLQYIDYITNPAFAVNYPDLTLSHGDLIVQSGDAVRHIFGSHLFHYAQAPDGNLTITASRAEEALTSAIMNVISGEMVRIALLTGNGTSDGSLFAALLADNNYDIQPAPLTTALLGGFDVAVLLSPTIDLSEDVLRRLDAFLYNDGQYGKTLLYAASAAQGAMPNLDRFLSEWGISFTDGAVFETTPERTYQFQPFFPTAEYAPGKYTDMLRDTSMPFLMPLARPMEVLFTARDGYFVETLLYFSAGSGVRPADAGDDFNADHATRRGPIPAFVVSGFHIASADGALLRSTVVISSSVGVFDAVSLQNTSLTNAEFILNLLGDLTDRDDLFNIQPKSLSGRTLGVTSAQASALGVILVGIVPAAILLAGIASWLFRRYK
jgi:hypothetical protein